MKRNLKSENNSASYCCESSATFEVEDMPNEVIHVLKSENNSASYCCESSATYKVDELNKEVIFSDKTNVLPNNVDFVID